MASRTHRVTVLVISQLLNYAVQIFTPILLVRILNKAAYGQYQEFFVYVTLISVFINFSIVDNILYFVVLFIVIIITCISNVCVTNLIIRIIS